jgi:hypothetical protein
MEPEEFKALVKKDIVLQSNTESMSYLKIRDDKIICPFCYKQMIVQLNPWKARCECAQSTEVFKLLSKYLEQIEITSIMVKDLYKDLNERALWYFKEDFAKNVFPEMEKELHKSLDKIMEIQNI